MYFFLVAFGLLLHVFFWGAGLALLLMPRPWLRFWPVLAAPAGLALQSLVVWAAAYANLAGTNVYAWWSEAIPAGLAIVALFRRPGLSLGRDLQRFLALWVVMAVCLCALVLPLARASRGLTTMSLGSCDAADYAAGARLFMEFARSDRSGFIGLSEVVSVMSVDNFFDFWLRLNHFTPSALIALNGTMLDCQPYEITGLMTVILLVASLPVVFWLARATMGYRGETSVWIAALYGLSPITWYAVFQVAMGQLLAAEAIALITWAGIALWRQDVNRRTGFAMFGVLAIGYALILGSYNFILLICFVPTLTCVGGLALWRGEWLRFARWAMWMLVPLVACGAIFAERLAGLAERFRLFQTYDFGWRIPFLSPEGWLGLLATTELGAFSSGLRFFLATVVVMATAIALVAKAKRGRREVYVALCLTVPVLIGYGYLNLRGVRLGTNASYDGYKLFSVFYPGILAAMCSWVSFSFSRDRKARLFGVVLILVVSGFTLRAAYRFSARMETPPLMVGRELLQVRKVEDMPQITSLNMRMPDMWTRLWANSFLLRKPQYFYYHSYEGRRNTPLRGDWDLNGGLTQVHLPEAGSLTINPQFSLVDTHSPYFVRMQIPSTAGWYELERQSRTLQRWRWTSAGTARISISNAHTYPLRAVCRFTNVHALVPRDFQVWVGGKMLKTVSVANDVGVVRVPGIVIPPGGTELEIRTTVPLTAPGDGDTRLLGFRIFGIELEIAKNPERTSP